MSKLYDKWSKIAYEFETKEDYDSFWEDYLPRETKFYQYLLENSSRKIKGTLSQLADIFNEDLLTMIGFIDGINSSLKKDKQINVEKIAEDTVIDLDIDLEKLFYNMHVAKADWLYNLDQWDKLISKEKRKEIAKLYKKSKTYVKECRVGRNDICPCGSGEKYKKCCGKNM